MDINNLIQSITPLYNSYKQNSNIINGTNALLIMWDIGDILKKFIDENNIAPHKLYRMIYGKSDGSENISQKSWITREFQGRCYRIRNIFISKDEISKKLFNLKKFTTFRESMPFFDNVKYKLEGNEMIKLLELLNSDLEYKVIIRKIHKLQSDKIGIKNPRTQKLQDLDVEKKSFVDLYNLIYSLLKKDNDEINESLNKDNISFEYIINIAKNTNALSQDGLKFIDLIENKESQSSIWLNYEKLLLDFISHTNALKRRRFRRLVGVERVVQLVDMLYLLSKKIKV